MSLLSQIKTSQVNARKARDAVSTGLLTTLIGEIEMYGKSNGNRETTNEEAVAIIKKFVKNIDESLSVLSVTDVRFTTLTQEKTILETLLPKQMTREDLEDVVSVVISNLKQQGKVPNMGLVMAVLKQTYAGRYDGKLASEVIKAAL